MRTITNIKLTDHFWLYEFIEGRALPRKAIELNWKNIDQFNIEDAREEAKFLEGIREVTNLVFQPKNGGQEIGVRINSGWRCKEWELIQGRSGKSQHVKIASDIVPTNCSNELAVEIINHLYHIYSPRTTGHKGGFAIKKPTYTDGNIVSVGFVHFDRRKDKNARWEY